MTLLLSLVVIAAGTIGGVALALLKRSDNKILSLLVRLYTEIFRAIPILVLLIWTYYVLPILFDWRLSPFVAAWLALSLHLSAFVAEAVRAGIESIAHSQYESGLALGMTGRQVMSRIIFPQAVVNMVPNLMSLYVAEIKHTSFASVIAVNEILHRANVLISETYRPLEIYTTVAVFYIILMIPLATLSLMIEKRLNKSRKTSRRLDSRFRYYYPLERLIGLF